MNLQQIWKQLQTSCVSVQCNNKKILLAYSSSAHDTHWYWAWALQDIIQTQTGGQALLCRRPDLKRLWITILANSVTHQDLPASLFCCPCLSRVLAILVSAESRGLLQTRSPEARVVQGTGWHTDALDARAEFLALPLTCVTVSKSLHPPAPRLSGQLRPETLQGQRADATLAWSGLQPPNW